MKTTQYQPKTGQACGCKRGVQRDNCPQCEGTGQRIDFSAIRARKFCADSNVPTVPANPLRDGVKITVRGPDAPACPAGEHTPGPWTVGLNYDGAPLIVEYQCRDICRVDSRDGVSNARLIARAPDLLAENARLRAALFGLSEAVSDLNPLYDDDSRAEVYALELANLSKAQDAARAALVEGGGK